MKKIHIKYGKYNALQKVFIEKVVLIKISIFREFKVMKMKLTLFLLTQFNEITFLKLTFLKETYIFTSHGFFFVTFNTELVFYLTSIMSIILKHNVASLVEWIRLLQILFKLNIYLTRFCFNTISNISFLQLCPYLKILRTTNYIWF